MRCFLPVIFPLLAPVSQLASHTERSDTLTAVLRMNINEPPRIKCPFGLFLSDNFLFLLPHAGFGKSFYFFIFFFLKLCGFGFPGGLDVSVSKFLSRCGRVRFFLGALMKMDAWKIKLMPEEVNSNNISFGLHRCFFDCCAKQGCQPETHCEKERLEKKK